MTDSPEDIKIKDGIISFSENFTASLSTTPELLLTAVSTAARTGLSFDVSAMKTILSNRGLINLIDKRKIYRFLLDLFINSKKPRKSIATLNTLGLSTELFSMNLNETSTLNHLNTTDYDEYFAIIFGDVEVDKLENFLVTKVGFHLHDTVPILRILKSIKYINGEEDAVSARRIINSYGKDKIPNVIRLLKALGHKSLAKLIKEQKCEAVSREDLKITTEMVKSSFHINDEEAEKLIDFALNVVITEPSYNEKDKLLILLNKKRKSNEKDHS